MPPDTPIQPVTVDEELVRLAGLLESLTDKLARATQETAEAEADWKVAESRAILASGRKGEDGRKAEAIDQHADLYRAMLRTRALRDALTEKTRSIRAQMEALRTLAANLRVQV